jgi:hypothetical protein
MTRIHIICEGQTEEAFIHKILSEYFAPKSIYLVPTLVGKPGHKGGNLRFDRLFVDIRTRLLDDTTAYCTTLVDFYGLPGDFPGKSEAATKQTSREKAICVKDMLREGLEAKLGSHAMRRFVPYVQMHEFEALLFSAPQKFAKGINQESLAEDLRRIREQFETPEDINDSSETAPSKRIIKIFPGYEKPLNGSQAAGEIGLDIIRDECPLFDEWIIALENLGNISSLRPT